MRVPAVFPPPSFSVSPGAPPPWPLTNQSAEAPFGPREGERRREPGRERCARWGGGGRVTCVHSVGLRGSPAVVKSVADGPPPLASERRPEKLGNELRRRVHELKTTLGRRFRGFEEARRDAARGLFAFLFLDLRSSNETSGKMPVELLNPNPMPP